MAIDSARKRRNAAGVTFPLSVSVLPDATQGGGWRASAGWGYYLAATAIAPAQRYILPALSRVKILATLTRTKILGAET